MALARKRCAGSIPGLDDSQEREAREKRRKVELEDRIRQREQEEKQRQQRTQTALERRRKERIEAERAQEARVRQKQQQQQQQQQQTKPASLRNPGTRATDRQAVGRPSSSSAPREARVTADTGSVKRPPVQSLSYDELMQIASGKKAAPAKPVAEKSLKPSLQPPLSAGSSRSVASRDSPATATATRRPIERSRSPRRTARARSPAEGRKPSPRPRPALGSGGSGHVRSSASAAALPAARTAKPPAPSDLRRDGISRKPSASTSSARPRERMGQAGVRASARPAAQEPPRVSRRPPEREIDRFGVRPGSSSVARKEPLERGSSRTNGAEPVRREHPAAAQRPNVRDGRDLRRPGDARQSHSLDSRPLSSRGTRPTAQPAARDVSGRSRPRNNLPPARGNAVDRSFRHKTSGASRRRYGDDDGEDDSEYDSLDDFIVDDEEEGCDRYRVGSIREMFGVRYRDVNDDDDDDMEVSALQLMREDRISAKIGRLEDEEEERLLEQAE
ncbi:hypothetical protein LPJ75_005090, partial [Coemansia sp. RSA 2598]